MTGSSEAPLDEGQASTIRIGPTAGLASTSARLNFTENSVTCQIAASNSAGGDLPHTVPVVGQIAAAAATVQVDAVL